MNDPSRPPDPTRPPAALRTELWRGNVGWPFQRTVIAGLRGFRGWFDDIALRRLFRNAGVLLSGKTMAAVMGLGSVALAARTLGAEGFGTLVLIHAFAQAVGELVRFQSWQAILRYGSLALLNDKRADLLGLLGFSVRLDLASATCGVSIAALAAPAAAYYLDWPPEVVPAAMLYGGIVLFMALGMPVGVLRLFDRFDLIAIQGLVPAIVRLLGAAVMFMIGGKLEGFLMVWALAVMLGGATLVAMAASELRQRGLLRGMCVHIARRSATLPPGIWRFVWATNASGAIALVTNQFPTLAVGWILGPAAAALYRVARQFGEALGKPTRFLVPAIYPQLAALSAQEATHALGRTVRRSAFVSGAGAVVVAMLLTALGKPLLHYTVGSEFLPAYPVMVLLAVSAVITMMAFPLEPLIVSVGLAGIALSARTLAAVIYAPVLLLTLDQWGLVGAGISAFVHSALIAATFTVAAARWLERQHSLLEKAD